MRARQKQQNIMWKKIFWCKKVTMRSNLLCDRKVPTLWRIDGLKSGGIKRERELNEVYTKEDFFCVVQKNYFWEKILKIVEFWWILNFFVDYFKFFLVIFNREDLWAPLTISILSIYWSKIALAQNRHEFCMNASLLDFSTKSAKVQFYTICTSAKIDLSYSSGIVKTSRALASSIFVTKLTISFITLYN